MIIKLEKRFQNFYRKKNINKNDLKQLHKFFDIQLSKLKKNVNRLLSHFIKKNISQC